MKRYLIILGKGLEGAAPDRVSLDIADYLLKHGDDANIIASSDIFCDKANLISDNISGIKFLSKSFIHDNIFIKNKIDESDCLLIMNVPTINVGILEIDSFLETIKYAHEHNKKIVFITCQHKLSAIQDNFYYDPKYRCFFDYLDIVFNHSLNNDFCQKFIFANNIKLKKLICRDINQNSVLHNLFGIPFDQLKKLYWKPFEEKKQKTIKFIGRAAKWKGPWLVRDLHTKYLRSQNYITTIEGITINTKSFVISPETILQIYTDETKNNLRDDVLYIDEQSNRIALNEFNAGTYVFKQNMPVYIFPAYKHELAMKRMGETQFSIEFIDIAKYFMRDLIDTAMLEGVAVGTIPIYRKQWAEEFVLNGKTLYDQQNDCGTIFVDDNDPKSAIELMNKLSEDNVLYDMMRNKAFDFYKTYFDSDVIFSQIINIINL